MAQAVRATPAVDPASPRRGWSPMEVKQPAAPPWQAKPPQAAVPHQQDAASRRRPFGQIG
jgi:hypothetical protein